MFSSGTQMPRSHKRDKLKLLYAKAKARLYYNVRVVSGKHGKFASKWSSEICIMGKLSHQALMLFEACHLELITSDQLG